LIADRLAALTYDPDAAAANAPPALEPERVTSRFVPAFGAAALQRIAERPSDLAHITRAIEAHRVPEVAEDETPVTAGSLEAALLGIWRLVLGRRVGLSDNFFEVGGTSLRAVQVIATIKKELKRDLSIVTLFECPTVSLLAARLRAGAVDSDQAPAVQRGERRRQRIVKRRAS